MLPELTTVLHTLEDAHISSIKEKWFCGVQKETTPKDFLPNAQEWFTKTKQIDIQNWHVMKHVDLMYGCTHFIENFCLKHKWNIQILPTEYPYYQAMGMMPTQPGNLKPGVPLIVSLPNHHYADLVEGWDNILLECEQKQIPIEIDGAYMLSAKDISIDLAHPCIQSIGMSLTKYGFGWNRVGVRWSKKKTMDSILIFNNRPKMQGNVVSCGQFIIDNIDRDYGWNTYGQHYDAYVKNNDLIGTKIIHIVKDTEGNNYGIGNYLSSLTKNNNSA